MEYEIVEVSERVEEGECDSIRACMVPRLFECTIAGRIELNKAVLVIFYR